MNMNSGNVLIVELGRGHSELLISQQLIFEKVTGGKVYFLGYLKDEWLHGEFYSIFDDCLLLEKKGVLKHGNLKRVRRFIREHRVKQVVFNTASGSDILKLSLFLPSRLKQIGVIHSISRFTGSGSQKLLRLRIRRFLVLSQHLLKYLPARRATFFYPLYFHVPEVSTPTDFRIVVPGNVQQSRRDYQALIRFAGKYGQQLRKRSISFVLLGDADRYDGPGLQQQIKSENLEDVLITFNGYIDPSDYYQVMAQASVVMPGITPDTPDVYKYLDAKISGSYNLAYGFRKFLLVHQVLSAIEDFKGVAYFYSEETLLSVLDKLVTEKPKYPDQERFQPEVQAERIREIL